MKKNIMAGILVFVFSFVALFLALDNRQETYARPAIDIDSRFKDINFYICVREYVGEEGILPDGITLKDSALNSILNIACNDRQITNATGVELMKNLRTLNLDDNKLTSIDISKNTELVDLILQNNKVTNINLSKNTKLEQLLLSHNKLTGIDLNKNTKLRLLELGGNPINSINLTKNTELTHLGMDSYNFKSIDLSKNTKLINLYLMNGKLTSINLSKNTKLKVLALSQNQLTSINLTKNTNLTELYIPRNKLTNINLSKNIKLQSLSLENNNFLSKPSKCTQLGNNCGFGYIVKFNSNGGTFVQAQNGYYVTKPSNPTKTGYRFVGWYSNANLTSIASFPFRPSSNTTLYAKWSQILAQDEEMATNSNNELVKNIMIVLALLTSAGLGYLVGDTLHNGKSKKKHKK